MEQMDRIMHRMELLLNEAQDAILDYDSKTLNNSNDSLSSLDTLSESVKNPIDIIKDSLKLAVELQLAFFYLICTTSLYFLVKSIQIFFNELNLGSFWSFRKRQINAFK